ncbi:MAG: agmatine deiminase family protein [Bacteroidaceae bacterium]|nr:agmatine deiminase family protein [Bacteroidaceae bacterium]
MEQQLRSLTPPSPSMQSPSSPLPPSMQPPSSPLPSSPQPPSSIALGDSVAENSIQGAYRLLPLPLPSPIYDPADGHRLPATYANFLILNGAVLMPTYGQPATDDLARSQLQKAFPKYDIVPIDCRALIRQHGSLHCSTMQYPVGVLT